MKIYHLGINFLGFKITVFIIIYIYIQELHTARSQKAKFSRRSGSILPFKMLLGIPTACFKTSGVPWERGVGDLDLGLPAWGKVCFSARMTEFENNKSELRSGASPRVKSSKFEYIPPILRNLEVANQYKKIVLDLTRGDAPERSSDLLSDFSAQNPRGMPEGTTVNHLG